MQANELPVYLISQYGCLIMSEGAFKPDGLRLVFEIENVPGWMQRDLTIKIMAYLNTFKSELKKE